MTIFEIDEFVAPSREKINFGAPLPLGYAQSLRRGMELRKAGMSYPTISLVISDYHGFRRQAHWWSRELRAMGAESKPHGLMWHGSERVRA